MPNSDKRILYTDDQGVLHIVIPSNNCGLTVEEIQAKDTDRSFRDAWTYTE